MPEIKMPVLTAPSQRRLTQSQLALLSEIADFSPVKHWRVNGYTSRRQHFMDIKTVTSCAVRGLIEILHENPARLILTTDGRKAIGLGGVHSP